MPNVGMCSRLESLGSHSGVAEEGSRQLSSGLASWEMPVADHKLKCFQHPLILNQHGSHADSWPPSSSIASWLGTSG